ncbi:MAG: O-antigen ligase family protein [Candidatus Korobacteraceae bacterium]
MPQAVATVIYVVGILGLFYLDRDEDSRMSKALWIPAVWLFLTSSRGVSLWLGMAQVRSQEAYVEGSPIDMAVFATLLIAALAVVISRGDRVGPLLGKNGPILLFFAFCAVSILWSDFPFVAFRRWIKALGDLAVVLIILTEPDPMDTLKRLITRLGFILFPLSILFGKYYPHLGRRLTNSWTEEITGVTTQKNTLGVICMLYGIGFLWMLATVYRDRADPNRTRRLAAYGTILITIVWLLAACNSTTSIVGFTMAGGVMLLATRPSLVCKPATVHLLVLAVLFVALFPIFLDSSVLSAVGKDPTLTGRTETWKLLLSMPINPWVGTGFESFWLGNRLQKLWDAYPNFYINEAHNGYIEVYLHLGLVGVSLLGLLLLTGYRKIIAAFRRDPDRGVLLLGFFLAVLFESLTEAAFRMMYPSWIFLLLASIAASQVIALEAVEQPGNEPAEYAQWIGAESVARKWEWTDESELRISPLKARRAGGTPPGYQA